MCAKFNSRNREDSFSVNSGVLNLHIALHQKFYTNLCYIDVLLYYDFVDLEKAFDRVPREVIAWFKGLKVANE